MVPFSQVKLKFNIKAFSNVAIVFAGQFLTIHGREKLEAKDTCVSLHVYYIE